MVNIKAYDQSSGTLLIGNEVSTRVSVRWNDPLLKVILREHEGESIVYKDPKLGIVTNPHLSLGEIQEDIQEELEALVETYAQAEDSSLSEDEQTLKQAVLELIDFEIQEDEGDTECLQD